MVGSTARSMSLQNFFLYCTTFVITDNRLGAYNAALFTAISFPFVHIDKIAKSARVIGNDATKSSTRNLHKQSLKRSQFRKSARLAICSEP